LGNQRPRFTPPEPHTAEKSLALPGAQAHLVLLAQMMSQQLAIPQIAVVTQVARMDAQVPLDFLPSPVVQAARTAFAWTFPQPVKTDPLEAMDPTLDRGGMFAKPFPHVITAMALANQQNSVQAMVVARLIRAADLLLHGDSHRLSISNLQSFHALLLAERRPNGKNNMLHYLWRCV
jgi:hypothetical protein